LFFDVFERFFQPIDLTAFLPQAVRLAGALFREALDVPFLVRYLPLGCQ
jgi:hypothetical protein